MQSTLQSKVQQKVRFFSCIQVSLLVVSFFPRGNCAKFIRWYQATVNSMLSVPAKKMERKSSDKITDKNSTMSSQSSAFVGYNFFTKRNVVFHFWTTKLEPLHKNCKKTPATQNCEVPRVRYGM